MNLCIRVNARLRHDFGNYHLLELENSEVNHVMATAFLEKIIRNAIKSNGLNNKIIEISRSSHEISILCHDSKIYDIINKFISRSFCYINEDTKKINGFTYYQVTVQVVDLNALVKFLNTKANYPIYKITDNFLYYKKRKMLLKIPEHENISKIKDLITRNNGVNIRFVSQNGVSMPVYNSKGKSSESQTESKIEVSAPIIFSSWEDPIISSVDIHEGRILVANFTPTTLEKLNELRKLKTGNVIAIEINGIVYSTFSLNHKRNINSGIQLVSCENKEEAKRIFELVSMGHLTSLKIVDEKFIKSNRIYQAFLLGILYLLLIGIYLRINRKRALNVAIILSGIIYGYFGYYIAGITIGFLLSMVISAMIFILSVFLNRKFNHAGNYMFFSLFLIGLIVLGYGRISFNAFLEYSATLGSINMGVSLVSYITCQIIKFSKKDPEELS